jgi:protein SCO1/2
VHFAAAAAGLLVAVAAAAGCRGHAPEERYRLRGTVVAVDRDAQRVTVAHEPVAGYMDAMTMPFRVKDGRMMAALEPGRLVDADLVVSGGSSWLENVVVSTAPGPPSLPSRVEGSTEPTPGTPAPDFALVDENGKPASLERFRGKAIALTFIYTRCPLPDYCPLMTDNFTQVERALAADPALATSTQLLSVSIDPAYDTPDVMRAYARRWAGDEAGNVPANWAFLTGKPADVRMAAERYGLVYETQSDQIVHTLRTAVIGPDGRLLKMYRGNEWKPEEIVRDLTDALR